MDKVKVLRIINRLNLGGPTYNAGYLTKYLDDQFNTILIAGLKDDSEASSEYIISSLGLNPEYVKDMYRSLNPLKDFKAYRTIRKKIQLFKPTIVHTHASKAGAVGRLAAIHEKVPIIIHTFHGHVFHSYFSKINTIVFLTIERYLAKRTNKIIAISKIQKKELSEEFLIDKPKKFEVIPLGFDLLRFQENKNENRVEFREKYEIKEKEVAIGIIGRLVPIKNHTYFIDAIKAIKKSVDVKIKAVIIGDGEELKQVLHNIESSDLQYSYKKNFKGDEDVILTSWIKNIETALHGLDIVVLTSLNEGTPVSLIEAQAAGLPVVSTDVGGVRDVVIHQHSGYIASNKEQFISYTKTLVLDESLRKKIGKNGINVSLERFSVTSLVENTSKLYSEQLQLME